MKQRKIISKSKRIDNQIELFLKNNPDIEESLRIFNITKEHYEEAVMALIQQTVKISTKSTNING